MSFLAKIHLPSGYCWLRVCHTYFERNMVDDGGSIRMSPNKVCPVTSFGWNLKNCTKGIACHGIHVSPTTFVGFQEEEQYVTAGQTDIPTIINRTDTSRYYV